MCAVLNGVAKNGIFYVQLLFFLKITLNCICFYVCVMAQKEQNYFKTCIGNLSIFLFGGG